MRSSNRSGWPAAAAALAVLLLGCEPESKQQTAVNRAAKSDPLPVLSAAKAESGAVQPLSGEASDGAIPEPIVEQDASALLARFHADLRELASGKRKQPITILHIGDDHVAADRLTGELRRLFQSPRRRVLKWCSHAPRCGSSAYPRWHRYGWCWTVCRGGHDWFAHRQSYLARRGRDRHAAGDG